MRTKDMFDNISTDKLKKEYIQLAFGKMIYGVDTDRRRKELCAEIERREGKMAQNLHFESRTEV